MSSLLYLIRHGATKQNEQKPVILQGSSIDGPLSEQGRNQAQRVADELATQEVRAIYASPMLRAQQTAQAIAVKHGLPVQTVPELHEVNVGEWEGKSWPEIMSADPEHYQHFMQHADVPYLGGESYQGVLERVLPQFEALFKRHTDEPFVVVAHNVVNRVYLSQLLMGNLDRSRKLPQQNCCINIVQASEAGTSPEVLTLNSILHLQRMVPDPAVL